MKIYRISKKVSHNYSWCYVNLPDWVDDLMKGFTNEIDPNDLYVKEGDGGLETDFHITIKYALLTDEVEEIRDRLDGEKKGKSGFLCQFRGDSQDESCRIE